MLGQDGPAIDCYERAAHGTMSIPEQHYLTMKAARLRQLCREA